MDRFFRDILDTWERRDKEQMDSPDAVKESASREFANFAAVAACADSARRVRTASQCEVIVFDELPVRHVDGLHIHAHTCAQTPYLHTHDFYEVVYVMKGSLDHILSLQPERVERMGGGDLCVVAPGVAHALSRPSKEDVVLKIDIPSKMYAAFASPGVLPREGRTSFCADADFDLFVVKAILEYFSDDALKTETCAHLIALAMLTAARGAREKRGGKDMFEAFLARFGPRGTIGDMAAMYSYSPGYMSKYVKRKTGKTFSQNLERHKLRVAAQLLAGTDMSIEAVASECGYANPSGLFKRFVAAYGVTPGRFRKALRQIV